MAHSARKIIISGCGIVALLAMAGCVGELVCCYRLLTAVSRYTRLVDTALPKGSSREQAEAWLMNQGFEFRTGDQRNVLIAQKELHCPGLPARLEFVSIVFTFD